MRQGFGDGRMSSLPWSNSRQGLDRARLGPPFLVHRPLDDVDAHCDGRCLALCDLRCRDHSHSYSYSYYYCSLCERGPHQMENLLTCSFLAILHPLTSSLSLKTTVAEVYKARAGAPSQASK